ncbi:MAG: hypothetical protein ACJA08_001384 [Cyclobacteriaceae bacterium]|jgi:hypothetical protein
MKPIQAVFPFLKLIFFDRKRLLKSLLNYTKEADRRRHFQKQYGKSVLPFVDINQLVEIDAEIDNYTYLDGTSRVIDIALLMSLCKLYENCNYLEIGSWRGESLMNVSKVAKTCTSISLSKADMEAFGMSKSATEVQRLFSKHRENINHIEANSLTYDFNQLDEKFDVIFIDGDHTYEGVKSDTENAFKLLRDEHSVIVWHDCGGGYEGYRYEVISAIIDGAPAAMQPKIFRVTNTLCGIFTNKQIVGEILKSPQTPTKVFSIHIKENNFEMS